MAEHPETTAQATRRRWITFGEIVAVAAVLISAASWWDGHQSRVHEETVEAAPKRAPSLLLKASVADDGAALKLAAARDDQVIQSQTLTAPEGETSESTGPASLAASLVEKAARAGAKTGRVPVAIVTRYAEGDDMRDDRALYDVGYRRHDRLIGGDRVELTGLSLVRRLGKTDPAAAVAARYGKSSN